MTTQPTPHSDSELFDNSFHEWLEAHGCKIHGDGKYAGTFYLSVDLNVLKPAIMVLANRRAEKLVVETNSKLIDALENHKKTLDYIVKEHAPKNATNYEVYLKKAIEVDVKIAALKATKEGK